MKKATVILDKDFVISKIDDKVFGSFVEPLGRCIYHGIYEPGHPKADANGFRGDVLEVTKPLNLTLNRFPGGNYTSTYRWEDSIGPKEQRPRRVEVAWYCIETNEFGINEFVDWSRLNGSGIMMTVNLCTRGVLDAMYALEYCNFPKGTYWSDLRIAHGYPQPHGIKYWCLTNEIDGPWQVGHTTGTAYGMLAREASRGMKRVDKSIKTVLAGSSNPGMSTYPSFDAAALEESYDDIDYLSIHHYLSNTKNDTANYLAKPLATDQFFKDTISTIDYVKAKLRSKHQVNISFDEYNTWHGVSETDEQRHPADKLWAVAPALLEDVYTQEDTVTLGGMLITILRHVDRIEIACISELVNCISHIRTSNGGGVWVLPPYYAYLHFSKYGRGVSLAALIDSPKYDSADFTGVPYLDAAAVLADNGDLAIFAINRNLTESLPLELKLRGFSGYKVEEHIIVESANPKDTNTEQEPDKVKPHSGGNAAIDDGVVSATLPKLSWNVIRLKKM
ncbi:MAG: alpha-N-arabinofuranosidase [Treponema sp.]|jgi:alpha-N-arabinofuranosidase|nr:alpha-N-arabinofuranosidase [Treponema sp.]